MLIRSSFEIWFELAQRTPMIAILHLHPTLAPALCAGGELHIAHQPPGIASGFGQPIAGVDYTDSFGNRCSRIMAPAGSLQLSGWSVVEIEDWPDPSPNGAEQSPVEQLPDQSLQFLLSSRYCEVDRFVQIAQDLFGAIPAGWTRAAAIRDWVNAKVRFDYGAARPTKTAMDVFTERVGVCRDFQHLAITLSRAQNIPARYATGYLGDIRHPYSGPGDFSAWYEVFLGGRWWSMDARHNQPRFGRVLVAIGRDAADVAITTSFGQADLKHFWVESNEVSDQRPTLPLLHLADSH